MIDITSKINSIPKETLKVFGLTREALLEQQKKETAAINLCGGLLGNCYIMAEVICWMLEPCGLNILARIKKQPWYKQEIKREINTAIPHLYRNIQTSRENSLTNEDYMMTVSSNMYDILEPDLKKLSNSINLLVGKSHIEDINTVSDFITIEILLQWITCYYESVIKQCKEIYSKAEYKSWYYQARNTGATNHWSKAVSLFGNRYIKGEINLNSPMILAGVNAIDTKMRSTEIGDIVTSQAEEYYDEGKGKALFNDALDILGLTEKSKHKQELKEAKKEYKESQESEYPAIDKFFNTMKDITNNENSQDDRILSDEEIKEIFHKTASILTSGVSEEEALRQLDKVV